MFVECVYLLFEGSEGTAIPRRIWSLRGSSQLFRKRCLLTVVEFCRSLGEGMGLTTADICRLDLSTHFYFLASPHCVPEYQLIYLSGTLAPRPPKTALLVRKINNSLCHYDYTSIGREAFLNFACSVKTFTSK